MVELIDLGWCIGRLDARNYRLLIASPSSRDESVYEPAESVQVNNKAGILKLRDALNKAYPKHITLQDEGA